MTPEGRQHLDKARQCIANAEIILRAGVWQDAGRAAYIAAFHAAQAFIFERTGKNAKTHSGVRGQFGKLAKDDPSFDPEARRFLSRSYELKTAADYDLDPDTGVTEERASDAIAAASRFVEAVAQALAVGPS